MPLTHQRALEVAALAKGCADDLKAAYLRTIGALESNSDLSVDWAPATKTFTANSGTDVCTATSHGLSSGQKARASSSGALPAPLTANTDYYLVAADTNTFQLALTMGGSAINLTDTGSGTHTLQPVPAYLDLDSAGNLSGQRFSPAQVANLIGTLAQFRNLLENQTVSEGDHLGNLNVVAAVEVQS